MIFNFLLCDHIFIQCHFSFISSFNTPLKCDSIWFKVKVRIFQKDWLYIRHSFSLFGLSSSISGLITLFRSLYSLLYSSSCQCLWLISSSVRILLWWCFSMRLESDPRVSLVWLLIQSFTIGFEFVFSLALPWLAPFMLMESISDVCLLQWHDSSTRMVLLLELLSNSIISSFWQLLSMPSLIQGFLLHFCIFYQDSSSDAPLKHR